MYLKLHELDRVAIDTDTSSFSAKVDYAQCLIEPQFAGSSSWICYESSLPLQQLQPQLHLLPPPNRSFFFAISRLYRKKNMRNGATPAISIDDNNPVKTGTNVGSPSGGKETASDSSLPKTCGKSIPTGDSNNDSSIIEKKKE